MTDIHYDSIGIPTSSSDKKLLQPRLLSLPELVLSLCELLIFLLF